MKVVIMKAAARTVNRRRRALPYFRHLVNKAETLVGKNRVHRPARSEVDGDCCLSRSGRNVVGALLRSATLIEEIFGGPLAIELLGAKAALPEKKHSARRAACLML